MLLPKQEEPEKKISLSVDGFLKGLFPKIK
jgi:hypothetical protein